MVFPPFTTSTSLTFSAKVSPELIRHSIFVAEERNEKDKNDYDSFRYIFLLSSKLFASFCRFFVPNKMKGLEWGRLWREYSSRGYDPDVLSDKIQKLLVDTQIHNPKGIWEYVLGDERDKSF